MDAQTMVNLLAASGFVLVGLIGLGLFLETEVFEKRQKRHG